MKTTSFALSALALAFAALGSAQASTSDAAPKAGTTTHPTPQAMAPHSAAYRPASDPMWLHDHVVESRAAQQRHWIAVEQHHNRLDAAQAASLRRSVAEIERDQQALRRQGQESFPQALAMSHRQDILDWAIRSARVDYEPQRIAALDATA